MIKDKQYMYREQYDSKFKQSGLNINIYVVIYVY